MEKMQDEQPTKEGEEAAADNRNSSSISDAAKYDFPMPTRVTASRRVDPNELHSCPKRKNKHQHNDKKRDKKKKKKEERMGELSQELAEQEVFVRQLQELRAERMTALHEVRAAMGALGRHITASTNTDELTTTSGIDDNHEWAPTATAWDGVSNSSTQHTPARDRTHLWDYLTANSVSAKEDQEGGEDQRADDDNTDDTKDLVVSPSDDEEALQCKASKLDGALSDWKRNFESLIDTLFDREVLHTEQLRGQTGEEGPPKAQNGERGEQDEDYYADDFEVEDE